ncbi:MAG: hypothetical protein WCG51_05540, partial [Elusimicrobiota bacterium]
INTEYAQVTAFKKTITDTEDAAATLIYFTGIDVTKDDTTTNVAIITLMLDASFSTKDGSPDTAAYVAKITNQYSIVQLIRNTPSVKTKIESIIGGSLFVDATPGSKLTAKGKSYVDANQDIQIFEIYAQAMSDGGAGLLMTYLNKQLVSMQVSNPGANIFTVIVAIAAKNQGLNTAQLIAALRALALAEVGDVPLMTDLLTTAINSGATEAFTFVLRTAVITGGAYDLPTDATKIADWIVDPLNAVTVQWIYDNIIHGSTPYPGAQKYIDTIKTDYEDAGAFYTYVKDNNQTLQFGQTMAQDIKFVYSTLDLGDLSLPITDVQRTAIINILRFDTNNLGGARMTIADIIKGIRTQAARETYLQRVNDLITQGVADSDNRLALTQALNNATNSQVVLPPVGASPAVIEKWVTENPVPVQKLIDTVVSADGYTTAAEYLAPIRASVLSFKQTIVDALRAAGTTGRDVMLFTLRLTTGQPLADIPTAAADVEQWIESHAAFVQKWIELSMTAEEFIRVRGEAQPALELYTLAQNKPAPVTPGNYTALDDVALVSGVQIDKTKPLADQYEVWQFIVEKIIRDSANHSSATRRTSMHSASVGATGVLLPTDQILANVRAEAARLRALADSDALVTGLLTQANTPDGLLALGHVLRQNNPGTTVTLPTTTDGVAAWVLNAGNDPDIAAQKQYLIDNVITRPDYAAASYMTTIIGQVVPVKNILEQAVTQNALPAIIFALQQIAPADTTVDIPPAVVGSTGWIEKNPAMAQAIIDGVVTLTAFPGATQYVTDRANEYTVSSELFTLAVNDTVLQGTFTALQDLSFILNGTNDYVDRVLSLDEPTNTVRRLMIEKIIRDSANTGLPAADILQNIRTQAALLRSAALLDTFISEAKASTGAVDAIKALYTYEDGTPVDLDVFLTTAQRQYITDNIITVNGVPLHDGNMQLVVYDIV